jgi:hypothetical protein
LFYSEQTPFHTQQISTTNTFLYKKKQGKTFAPNIKPCTYLQILTNTTKKNPSWKAKSAKFVKKFCVCI